MGSLLGEMMSNYCSSFCTLCSMLMRVGNHWQQRSNCGDVSAPGGWRQDIKGTLRFSKPTSSIHPSSNTTGPPACHFTSGGAGTSFKTILHWSPNIGFLPKNWLSECKTHVTRRMAQKNRNLVDDAIDTEIL